MDKLELRITDRQNDKSPCRVVMILVNGVNIVDILKRYEITFAKKERAESIAGNYDELSPETLYRNLMSPSEFDRDENGKVSILECECGWDGCWPMKVKTVDLGNKIIWTEFEQPHRTSEHFNFWDYSDFGQFCFDKNSYEEQLEKLRKAIH